MAWSKNKAMEAARKAHEKGQYDRAIKEYLRIVKEDPKDVRVWLKIGDLYAKAGQKQEATDTYIKVAKFYSEQGFYLKAVAVYKQILKLDPRLVEVNLKLAELYRQLGLLSDAMQHFEMVAAFFHKEGKTREALATIRQLVELDPENVATRIKLAELYSKESMTKEAVAEFAHACDYLRKHNRQDDFIKVAERLLFHDAEDIPLCRELASLYLRRNDARRALAKLQLCFKADPRNVETLALLAQAFQKLDQKGKTVSVLKELARVLTDSGERAKAEDVHRKILEFVPNDPESRKFLGEPPPSSPPSGAQPYYNDSLSPAPHGSPIGRTTGSMPLVRASEGDETLGEADVGIYDEDSFVADLELDEGPSYSAVEGSSVSGEVHSDEIVKILTETDVYVKYGLHQKAIDHLRRVFDLDSANIEARERLKDIFLTNHREQEAIGELMHLAEQSATASPEKAVGYLREVLAIDAGHQGAYDLADRHRLHLVEDQAPPRAGGELAAIGDELDFDDLDFDDAAASASAPDDMLEELSESSDPGYDFAVDDAPPPLEKSSITMEVDLEQVEEAVSIDDIEEVSAVPLEDSIPVVDLDEDFVYEAPGFDEDLPFDPADAAAFDAEQPEVAAEDTPPMHLDFAPEQSGDDVFAPPEDGPIFGADEFEVVDDSIDDPIDVAPIVPAVVPPRPPAVVPPGPPRAASPVAEVIPEMDPAEFEALPIAAEENDFDTPIGVPTREEPMPSQTAESPAAFELSATHEDTAEPETTLEDDLDEADFFISQGLTEEAMEVLSSLLERYPDHPLVMAKLKDAQGGAEAFPETDDDFVTPDMAVESSDGGFRTEEQNRSVILEKPIDDEDADTHYDLGLAYKEMSLYGEAIKAFEKVITVPSRAVQCHLMIGLCHREQGNLSEAINQFKAGLYVEQISSAEKFDLYYEIGSTYEALHDPQEALYYYEMVLKRDTDYRDIAARVKSIKFTNGSSGPAGRDGSRDSDDAMDPLLIESSERSR